MLNSRASVLRAKNILAAIPLLFLYLISRFVRSFLMVKVISFEEFVKNPVEISYTIWGAISFSLSFLSMIFGESYWIGPLLTVAIMCILELVNINRSKKLK